MRTILLLLLTACGLHTSHPTLPSSERNAVMTDYLRGESFDQLAADHHLGDRDEARVIVHDAMVEMTRRFYRDR